MSNKGKINVYICGEIKAEPAEGGGITIKQASNAGHRTVTINRDDGQTAFSITCRHPGCNQEAYSQMYHVDQSLTPAFEWFKPGPIEMQALHPTVKRYVEGGRLLIRPIVRIRHTYGELS